MKRAYCKPSVTMLPVRTDVIMTSSNQITDIDKGITFGGVDNEGTIDPSVKAFWFGDEDSEDDWEDVFD